MKKLIIFVLAIVLFGSCKKDIDGCTDPNAINYDASANIDNGNCTYDGKYMFSITINDTLTVTSSWYIDSIGPVTSPPQIFSPFGIYHFKGPSTDPFLFGAELDEINFQECYPLGLITGILYFKNYFYGLDLGIDNNGKQLAYLNLNRPEIKGVNHMGFVSQSQPYFDSITGISLLSINMEVGELSTYDTISRKYTFNKPSVGSFSGDVFRFSSPYYDAVTQQFIPGSWSIPIKLEFEFITPRFGN